MIKEELQKALVDEIIYQIDTHVEMLLELGLYKPHVEIILTQAAKRAVYKERG